MFRNLILAALMVVVLAMAGCEPEQINQVEDLAEMAQRIGGAGQSVVNSPAGYLIPEPYRTIANLSLAGLLGLSTAVLGIIKSKYKTALTEVVDGADQFINDGDIGNDIFKLKQNIAQSTETRKLVGKIKGAA